MNLNKQIKEIISRSMPALEAENLKTYIEDSEALKEDHEDLKRRYKDSQEVNNTLLTLNMVLEKNNKDVLEKENALNTRELLLNAKEKELTDMQNTLANMILQIKLDAANEKISAFMDLVELIFKAPVVKETIQKNMLLTNSYTSNDNGSSSQMTTPTTETVTKETI